MVQWLQETLWQFLRKLNTELTFAPAILLPSIYTPENWKYVHTKTCTLMLRAALFVKPKNYKQPQNYKQPKCPPTDEWINKTYME